MRPEIIMGWAIIAIFIILAAAVTFAADKPDTILTEIQTRAVKMKDNKKFVAGFCAGVQAVEWQEAQQHGWNIPADSLMPPEITFPDKTVFHCKEK